MVKILIQDSNQELAQTIKKGVWEAISDVLNWGLHWGEGANHIQITVGTLLLVTTSFFATSYLLGLVRKIYTRNLNETDTQKFISVFKFIKYLSYVVVVFAVLSFSGVNVTPVLAASAALLVGVGLALQELFQDVLGGIFIMLDKSLQAGDIIEVDGRVGRVVDISLRTTRAVTRDDKVVIIPNHKFISDTVYNYTQNHKQTRETVTVGVAYGSDTTLVKSLLLESLEKDTRILSRPKPFCCLKILVILRLYLALIFSFRIALPIPWSKATFASGLMISLENITSLFHSLNAMCIYTPVPMQNCQKQNKYA